MIVFYNILLFFFTAGVRIVSFFHPKARAFVTGRKDVFKKLASAFSSQSSPVVWVHCASLGEFEQGRPLIELLKQEFPQLKILLTFFSPSGYEVRKNYNLADHVCYLPMDSSANAQRLVAIVKPVFVVFVKYEFWFHFTRELRSSNIPILSISSIFRREQLFFKPYGGFYRRILQAFSFFFVQSEESVRLLRSIGIQQCMLAGDTRFDRVFQVVKNGEELPIVKNFKNQQKTMVVGSCWPEDLDVLAPFINQNTMKFILAPHEISEHFLTSIENTLGVKSIRYSAVQGKAVDDYQVLIIDNIGMLSRLYRYGEFAYVGGAFGKGLHNILEAACYGVPIFFGNKNYQKFQEALDLINRGGAFEVKDYLDLKQKFELMDMPESFLLACEVTKSYVMENLGATEKIMRYCRTLLK